MYDVIHLQKKNNNASCPEKVLICLRKILCYLELRKIQKSFYLNVQNLLYLLEGNGFKYSVHTDVLRVVMYNDLQCAVLYCSITVL